MKKQLVLFLLLLQGISTVNADAITTKIGTNSQNKEAASFGAGAIIGGLIAGPPGVVIGAAAGSWFGDRESKHDKAIASLQAKLDEKNTELSSVVSDFSQLQQQYKQHQQKMALTETISLNSFQNGLCLAVYFRTDEYQLETRFNLAVEKLSLVLRDFPELQVKLHAHTDERGDVIYNRNLSLKRADAVLNKLLQAGIDKNRIQINAHGENYTEAKTGDLEAYSFDRRVDLLLSLEAEA